MANLFNEVAKESLDVSREMRKNIEIKNEERISISFLMIFFGRNFIL